MALRMRASNDIPRPSRARRNRRRPSKPKPRPQPQPRPSKRQFRVLTPRGIRPAKSVHYCELPQVEIVEPEVVNIEIESAGSTSSNPGVEPGVEVVGPLINKGKAPMKYPNINFPDWCKPYLASSSSSKKDDDDINKGKAPLPSSSPLFRVKTEEETDIPYSKLLFRYKCDFCRLRFKHEDDQKKHRMTHIPVPGGPITRPLFPLRPAPPAPSPLIDRELNLALTLAPALNLELTLAPAMPYVEAMPMTDMANGSLSLDLGLAVGKPWVQPKACKANKVGSTKIEWFKAIEGIMFNVARNGATNSKPLSDEELELKF